MAIQIAKQLTQLEVIATASRPESADWCRELGADAIADHRNLLESVRGLGRQHVDGILCTNDFEGHWDAMAELVAPQGVICSILGASQLDATPRGPFPESCDHWKQRHHVTTVTYNGD